MFIQVALVQREVKRWLISACLDCLDFMALYYLSTTHAKNET